MVADARVNDIREAAPPMVYFPIAQAPGNIDGLEIRTMADPQWIAPQVRQAVAAVDHRIPIIDIITLNEEVKNNLTQQRLIARLTSIFGLLALGLACLGLYGVMSYIVERRTSEIGVRLALGSTRSAVLRLVLKETLLLITARRPARPGAIDCSYAPGDELPVRAFPGRSGDHREEHCCCFCWCQWPRDFFLHGAPLRSIRCRP